MLMRRPGRSMSSRVSSRMAPGRAACTAARAMARRWAGVAAACWTARICSAVIGSTVRPAPLPPRRWCGGVGERQAASSGEPEQRAQRGDGVVAAVAAQRLQDGVNVAGGDLPQVAACCRPALDEGPHPAEVEVDSGVQPGGGCGRHRRAAPPARHGRHGRTRRAARGAAVDPGPDRRGGVMVQQLQPGEDLGDRWLSCGCVAAPAGGPATAGPGRRLVAVEDVLQAVEHPSDRRGRPAAGLGRSIAQRVTASSSGVSQRCSSISGVTCSPGGSPQGTPPGSSRQPGRHLLRIARSPNSDRPVRAWA